MAQIQVEDRLVVTSQRRVVHEQAGLPVARHREIGPVLRADQDAAPVNNQQLVVAVDEVSRIEVAHVHAEAQIELGQRGQVGVVARAPSIV